MYVFMLLIKKGQCCITTKKGVFQARSWFYERYGEGNQKGLRWPPPNQYLTGFNFSDPKQSFDP